MKPVEQMRSHASIHSTRIPLHHLETGALGIRVWIMSTNHHSNPLNVRSVQSFVEARELESKGMEHKVEEDKRCACNHACTRQTCLDVGSSLAFLFHEMVYG